MNQKYLDSNNIDELETRYRAHLINSLGGFKSVCLIGTKNRKEQTNLAIFSSVFHIGANPPLIAFIVRPDSVDRHTLSNILETDFYSINHINENIYKQAHQTSARYELEVSEFEVTGLQSIYKNDFFAPFVAKSNVQMGVQFKQRIDIELNGTIMVIGEIKEIYFPENCVSEDGFIDLEKAGTITCSGLDSYHSTSRLARLSYAKPDKEIIHLEF
jgi:flavin reductase (DIM6/NTAB) family NADH-FMN oxidoreductase RutF